jgi:predicted hydrocarbon binding protein
MVQGRRPEKGETPVDKRTFLKSACELGACACAGALGGADAAVGSDDGDELAALRDVNRRLDWRLNLARRQLATLLTEIEPIVDSQTRTRIMRQLGRNCAKSLGWAEKYRGDPKGFFQHMRETAGETLSMDEEQRVISIVTPERPCVCPLVADNEAPAYYCDCSLGWQMETYETILGRPVEVTLKESALRGSTRCVFEIRVV